MPHSAPLRSNRQKCPICAGPPQAGYAPFCSRRCRDRDLLNWLGDGYRVPGPPAEERASEYPSDGLDSEA
jgi:endogenous inhibitor of DNA gyrase (YacG/DUF329 family)